MHYVVVVKQLGTYLQWLELEIKSVQVCGTANQTETFPPKYQRKHYSERRESTFTNFSFNIPIFYQITKSEEFVHTDIP